MRISLSISLHFDIDREKPEDPHPQGDTYAATERADHQGIGFHIDMPNHSE